MFGHPLKKTPNKQQKQLLYKPDNCSKQFDFF